MYIITMKEKMSFFIILKDLANNFRGRFAFGVEVDLEGN